MFGEMPKKIAKFEPAEVAEHSAIEQAVSIWWLSNNEPLYWKVQHLQAGLERLNIGKSFKSMLERHPQMYSSFYDIQSDLPENNQAAPSLGPNRENTVEKRILDANGNQNTQNCMNSGEEQLIAFGEATIGNDGMGTDKTPRTVTFELSQAQSGASSSTPTSPHLYQVTVCQDKTLSDKL